MLRRWRKRLPLRNNTSRVRRRRMKMFSGKNMGRIQSRSNSSRTRERFTLRSNTWKIRDRV